MMWIAGVSPLEGAARVSGRVVALIICGIPAAPTTPSCTNQHRTHRWFVGRLGTRCNRNVTILVAAIAANVAVNVAFPEVVGHFPLIGAAVWVALLATAPLRKPDWSVLPETFSGTVFLLALVTIASMMPVEKLPPASWHSAMGLGFISAAFDNIPLTALALQQGGFDWGMLAYTVGFGGSMIWFGSSAGVALSNMFPEAKSVGRWVRDGWHVTVAYVIGFFVLLAVLGWQPSAAHTA